MRLKDKLAFGMVLPNRSPDPLDMAVVRSVAQRAEALGFQDLWVSENTLDHVYSLDPIVALTYAAAVTETIRLGVSVVTLPMHSPLHVAHQISSLDTVSHGRAILGIGLGREREYRHFQVPLEHRVRRFRESIELIKALWMQPSVRYRGDCYQLEDAGIALKPVQKPHPPVWLGGMHPDAVKRAAVLGDGWMAGGTQSAEDFSSCVPLLREALEKAGRDLAAFPVSKRVYIAVDEKPGVARAELNRWFTEVNRKPGLTDSAGIHGTPAQVHEQLETLRAAGATHILLNAVSRYREQVEALAEVIDLG